MVTSLAVANKQITAPMRQAWINSLRDTLAELVSTAHHYYVAGFEDRTDAEYQRITLLQYKVKLMLNPLENEHQNFEKLVDQMVEAIGERGQRFEAVHREVIALSRSIFKREWNRVRDKIELPRSD